MIRRSNQGHCLPSGNVIRRSATPNRVVHENQTEVISSHHHHVEPVVTTHHHVEPATHSHIQTHNVGGDTHSHVVTHQEPVVTTHHHVQPATHSHVVSHNTGGDNHSHVIRHQEPVVSSHHHHVEPVVHHQASNVHHHEPVVHHHQNRNQYQDSQVGRVIKTVIRRIDPKTGECMSEEVVQGDYDPELNHREIMASIDPNEGYHDQNVTRRIVESHRDGGNHGRVVVGEHRTTRRDGAEEKRIYGHGLSESKLMPSESTHHQTPGSQSHLNHTDSFARQPIHAESQIMSSYSPMHGDKRD